MGLFFKHGSVRGAVCNDRPYRDHRFDLVSGIANRNQGMLYFLNMHNIYFRFSKHTTVCRKRCRIINDSGTLIQKQRDNGRRPAFRHSRLPRILRKLF